MIRLFFETIHVPLKGGVGSLDDLLMPSLLAQSNEVPLILGFAGLLSKFEVRFDYQSESAYLLPTSIGLHEIA